MTFPAEDRRARVVVLGAGVAGLEFSLALTELAPGRAALELIDPSAHFVYRPLGVAEAFGLGQSFRLELFRVAAHVDARWRRARVVSVDQARHVVGTSAGAYVEYDLLVVACGARAEAGLPGAATFPGPDNGRALRAVLADLEREDAGSVAFVVPPGASWMLPLYELALLTADRFRHDGRAVRLVLVTPETRPLEQFGPTVSETVARLLASAGIEVHCGTSAAELAGDGLRLVPEGSIAVDRAVSLPRLRGPGLGGVASAVDGFLPTDRHGLVHGCDDVYAAGDVTTFPLKHGGIAVQQADAAAEAIAARLGAGIRPREFRPLLRGLLLTGREARFLWADPTGGRGETSVVATYPLWWPPGKIADGRIADYLRSQGLPVAAPPAGPATVPVTVPAR